MDENVGFSPIMAILIRKTMINQWNIQINTPIFISCKDNSFLEGSEVVLHQNVKNLTHEPTKLRFTYFTPQGGRKRNIYTSDAAEQYLERYPRLRYKI